MKKRIFLCTVIAICSLISVVAYKHFTSGSNESDKGNNNQVTLVSVDIYDVNNPEKVITLRPQMDGDLISQYGELLTDQSPNKEILGANFRVTVFYSDGSGTFYDIISSQIELTTLCNRTVNSSLAKQL